MPGRFRITRQEFQIDGAWDGRSHDAFLRQFKAGIGAGCSTAAEAAFAALGASSPVLTGVIVDQVEAIRDTVEVDSGTWTVTLDLARQEVTFLNTGTGEIEVLPVKSNGGQRSAGSFALELMGIPAVETSRGCVTIDSVMALLYLRQAYAGVRAFGGATAQDMAVTIEVVFGLLDEKAARLKAEASSAGRRATRAATDLRKAEEQRLAYGLPTAADLDTAAATLAKRADAAAADAQRLAGELDPHRAALTGREQTAARARQRMSQCATDADRAQKALGPLHEARGLARQTLQRAQERCQPITQCPECEQSLDQRTGPGEACPLCRQPDPGRAARLERRVRERESAQKAAHGADDALQAGNTAVEKAVAVRRKAEEDVSNTAGQAEAYRLAEVAPREAALAQAIAAEREAKAEYAAVLERRKELARIVELQRAADQAAKHADDARAAWAEAEGDAQERRKRTAADLSLIFAEKMMQMAPDKVRSASLDPKTFTPRVNGRSLRHVALSAGLISIANLALHLTLLEAASTMPDVLLPAMQWLDAPIDGVGGGPEGERLASAVLQVTAETAATHGAGGAQVILTTPQDLPVDVPGAEITELNSENRFIPHTRPDNDETGTLQHVPAQSTHRDSDSHDRAGAH
ncbi:hypothetical protein [Streptomyces sp. CBMA123]|uniref:hypothetical protein n=1 Tax=Streptomyces sp. CBMA123 TaxID=1896313 RepID=UPI001661C065|nr:hypothetical protein [Streptomyces sp. CBMA123]MBD0692487.1 hypothetical protein [Streptomyces sp. CBMA123]